MPYKVHAQFDNLPEGALVGIPGLGDLVNGDTVVIDDDRAEQFRNYNESYDNQLDEEGNHTGGFNATPADSLLKTDIPGVTVEKVTKKDLREEQTEDDEKLDEKLSDEVLVDQNENPNEAENQNGGDE